MGFLLRCRRGKGPHLSLNGESPGSPRLAARNLGFLSGYDRDLKNSLVWPPESPVSMRVAMALSGFLCSRCQGRGPHLKLRPEPQCSSPVLTWISRFLWSFHRGIWPRLVWRHARPLSLEMENHCQASCWPDLGIGGFLPRSQRAVKHAIML